MINKYIQRQQRGYKHLNKFKEKANKDEWNNKVDIRHEIVVQWGNINTF